MKIAILFATAAVIASRAGGDAPLACARPEYRQFDFFAGDWDVFDVGSTTVKAHGIVTSMLDGCAVRELYQRLDGYSGESFTLYDAARKMWHQSWATNHGELLVLEGGLVQGNMVLTGSEHPVGGAPTLIRGTWHRERNGEVRETAVRSSDGGKTWSPVFDLTFRRRMRESR